MASLSELVKAGRIEKVTADTAAARAKVEDAKRHLSSAAQIASTDLEGAYALAYDAARKAVEAHLLANGYRIANRAGAHAAAAEYAEWKWRRSKIASSARRFDGMRQLRNRTDGGWHIAESVLLADMKHAENIVQEIDSEV
jgi:hypothetical protein